MKRWVKIIALTLVLCFAAGSLSAQAREFRLGIISEKPVEKKISGYAPLARYVAERLKRFGVTGGRVIVAVSVEQMLQKIRRGEVDVVLESAFSTLVMSRKSGLTPKLLVWKEGEREYRTVFFVRKDSPIARLSDLRGRVLALQDPGSTSAFLIPMAELRRGGLKAVPLKGKGPASAVRYVFVPHEKNQAFWVIQKKADAAAFGSDNWDELGRLEKQELRLIHSSGPVLRYLASFHPRLSPDLSQAIAAVLVQMDRDPEGRRALSEASGTTKIEPLSARDLESLEDVRKLMPGR